MADKERRNEIIKTVAFGAVAAAGIALHNARRRAKMTPDDIAEQARKAYSDALDEDAVSSLNFRLRGNYQAVKNAVELLSGENLLWIPIPRPFSSPWVFGAHIRESYLDGAFLLRKEVIPDTSLWKRVPRALSLRYQYSLLGIDRLRV